MSLDYRNNDAVLTICQNNNAKTITISDINKSAADMIGFSEHELINVPLKKILPVRIGELLDEYVEFDSNANDVGTVLSRVQSFSIVGKDGKEKNYKLKLSQSESGAGNLFFSLILRDALGVKKSEAIRSVIQENFKGHESLDTKTGLPDKSSMLKDIELMRYYASRGSIKSCFGLLQIDGYTGLTQKYGEETANNLLKHTALIARQSLRPDDIITSFGDGRIGVLLVDVAFDSVKIAFNRLRWQIAANPYTLSDNSSIGISVSICLCKISPDLGEDEIIGKCDKSLNNLGNGKNTLLEVFA